MISSMLDLGVVPDSVTINTLVDACVTNGRMAEAEAFLYMEGLTSGPGSSTGLGVDDNRKNQDKAHVAPGVEAYTSLISGYAARGDEKSAMRIYSTMRKEGVAPNKFTLTALVDAHLRAGKGRRARSLIENGVPAMYEYVLEEERKGKEIESENEDSKSKQDQKAGEYDNYAFSVSRGAHGLTWRLRRW